MNETWTASFLEHLARSGSVAVAARLTGVRNTAVHSLKRSNPDFAAALAEAIEDSTDILELEARRRAVDGVRKPVVYQGQLTPVWARDANGEVVTVATMRTKPDGSVYTVDMPVQEIDDLGNPVYLSVTEYSDALLALLLKGNRRSKYGDKQEITGLNGGPVQIDETKRASRVAALLGLAQVRRDMG